MGKEIIKVRIKFFSGIDKELGLLNYNPAEGVEIKLPGRKRLRSVLVGFGLKKISRFAIFRNGERMSAWAKLNDNDEVSCLKVSGGG